MAQSRFKDWSAFPYPDYLNKCEKFCQKYYSMSLEDSIEFHDTWEVQDIYEAHWLNNIHPHDAVHYVMSDRIDLMP